MWIQRRLWIHRRPWIQAFHLSYIRFGGTLNSGTSLNSETSLNSRTLRTLMRWYWRNLVTFGENRFCHSLNNNKVRYIEIFILEWNFTRNIEIVRFLTKKTLKNIFRAFFAQKSDFLTKKCQKFSKNMKLIKKVKNCP